MLATRPRDTTHAGIRLAALASCLTLAAAAPGTETPAEDCRDERAVPRAAFGIADVTRTVDGTTGAFSLLGGFRKGGPLAGSLVPRLVASPRDAVVTLTARVREDVRYAFDAPLPGAIDIAGVLLGMGGGAGLIAWAASVPGSLWRSDAVEQGFGIVAIVSTAIAALITVGLYLPARHTYTYDQRADLTLWRDGRVWRTLTVENRGEARSRWPDEGFQRTKEAELWQQVRARVEPTLLEEP